MSGYTIVQFTAWGDGTSSQAVPRSWVFDNASGRFCYFPTIGARKAIRQQTKPSDSWQAYAVKVLNKKPISTYERALEKEIAALETSGIDTTDDDGQKKKTRKRKQPARYCSTEEDSCPTSGELLWPLVAILF